MERKLNKVLVATDFSDIANAAIPYAYAIVEGNGEVHLIHVVEHQEVPSPMYSHYSSDELNNPEKRAALSAELEQKLSGLVPDTANVKSVTTTVGVVFHPHVAEGIVKEVGQRQVDVIAVGSHGRNALATLLLGSVAEQVVKHSSVPVLIVPHGK